jgi:hypothetical protein
VLKALYIGLLMHSEHEQQPEEALLASFAFRAEIIIGVLIGVLRSVSYPVKGGTACCRR